MVHVLVQLPQPQGPSYPEPSKRHTPHGGVALLTLKDHVHAANRIILDGLGICTNPYRRTDHLERRELVVGAP